MTPDVTLQIPLNIVLLLAEWIAADDDNDDELLVAALTEWIDGLPVAYVERRQANG